MIFQDPLEHLGLLVEEQQARLEVVELAEDEGLVSGVALSSQQLHHLPLYPSLGPHLGGLPVGVEVVLQQSVVNTNTRGGVSAPGSPPSPGDR